MKPLPWPSSSTTNTNRYLQVEGDRRVSTAIKYLTQSTWSHAAIYIGDHAPHHQKSQVLLEADVELGVITCSLSKYEHLNTRVCRPIGMSKEDKVKVVDHVVSRIGHTYDLKNITDLARFLWPMPPVPSYFRRRMITLGSGDPTRAICSTLIAEAFYSVNFPILPPPPEGSARGSSYTYIVPRDFDVSPYFEVIKPRMKAALSATVVPNMQTLVSQPILHKQRALN